MKGGEESEKGGFTIISVLLVRAGKVGWSLFSFFSSLLSGQEREEWNDAIALCGYMK